MKSDDDKFKKEKHCANLFFNYTRQLNSLMGQFKSAVFYVQDLKLANIITCRKWLRKVMKFLHWKYAFILSLYLAQKKQQQQHTQKHGT